MSSYIKFMFKYLFQSEQLDEELEYRALLNDTSVVDGSSSVGSAAAAAGSTTSSGVAALTPDKRSRCLSLARTLLAENRTASALRSFVDFEGLARNSSWTTTVAQAQGQATSVSASPVSMPLQQPPLELLECYNQLQLQDYYSGYDIFIGLRIASTLTILFAVFILFVIYKTGCHEGQASRSQFSATSGAAAANKQRKRQLKRGTGAASGRLTHLAAQQQQQQHQAEEEEEDQGQQSLRSQNGQQQQLPSSLQRPLQQPPEMQMFQQMQPATKQQQCQPSHLCP